MATTTTATIVSPPAVSQQFERGDDILDDGILMNTTDNTSTTTSSRRFFPPAIRKTKSKDKAHCEYYNEELELEDGELPSLQQHHLKPSSSFQSESLKRRDLKDDTIAARKTASPFRLRRAVTPTKSDNVSEKKDNQKLQQRNRSSTPVLNNTEQNKRRSFWKNGRFLNSSKEEDDIDVNIETTKLSIEDKRKHRAFWNQFENQNSDVEVDSVDEIRERKKTGEKDGRFKQMGMNGNIDNNNHDEDEDDRKNKSRDTNIVLPPPQSTTPATTREFAIITPVNENNKANVITPRQNEVLEDDDEEENGHGKDFYNMVINMCTDCNWLLADDKKPLKKDYTRSNLQLQDEQQNQRMFKVKKRAKRVAKDDMDSDDAIDKDGILGKESTLSKEDDTNESKRKDVEVPSESKSSKLEELQNYENTKIEVEYDDMDMENESDPKFLQLHHSGSVAVYARPNESNNRNQQFLQRQQQQPRSQPGLENADIDPMPSDERGGYMLGRSKSWSEPQKNAYLQAMAQKAREDFQKSKSLLPYVESNDNNQVEMMKNQSLDQKEEDHNDDDTLVGILGEKTTPTKPSKSIDWTKYNWTPSEKRKLFHLVNSEGMTPDEATDEVIAERIRHNIAVDNDMNVRSTLPLRRSKTYDASSNYRQVQDELSKNNRVLPQNSDNHGESTILSNLRNKPGFNRVVNTNLQDQPIELPIEDSGRQSVPAVEAAIDSTNNATRSGTAGTSRKKKGSKNGPKWHQMDDNEDDYNQSNDVNTVSTIGQRSLPKAQHASDDIFDFDLPGEEKKGQVCDSMKIDPYHDSCDVSLLGSTMAGDQTIMSGKSYYTTATNSSAWSISTRRRHRGAAKNRLPDDTSKKPVGWLDTIKAAAVTNNREWDPEVGWINYVEPQYKDPMTVDQTAEIVNISSKQSKPPKNVKVQVKTSKKDSHRVSHVSDAAWDANSGNVFPNKLSKKQLGVTSRIKDDNEAVSIVVSDSNAIAATEVSNNRSQGSDDVEIHSNAETEIVSNRVENMLLSSTLSCTIAETIGEDSSEEEDEEEMAEEQNEKKVEAELENDDTWQIGENYDYEQDRSQNDPSSGEESGNIEVPRREPITSRLTSDDDAQLAELKNSLSSAQAKAREFLEKIKCTSVTYEDREVEEKKVKNTAHVHSQNLKVTDVIVEDVTDDEDDSDTDGDGDEFNNVLTSFEFGDDEKDSNLEEDGFRVIETKSPIDGFGGKVSEEKLCDDDKSVKSNTSLMSAKAVEWRKKVQVSKKSMWSQQEERKVAENSKPRVNIFVSAADENSTFEMREKPKILNVDEDDTLFDFHAAEGNLRDDMKNVEVERLHQKKRKSQSKRIPHSSKDSDDFSEITTPTVDMSKATGTFFDRLQSCGTGIVGSCEPVGSGLPKAHLQFLRNTNDVRSASKSKDNRAGGLINMLTSPGLCGRPETVEETDEKFLDLKKSNGGKNVASSYLEAINAGKTSYNAVKRTPSTISTGSTNSETWQRFLDKRAVALSSKRSNTSGEVSKAAQEYASKTVEEIIKKIDRSGSHVMSRPPSSGRPKNSRQQEMMSKRDAVKAAEDLAAARVMAMAMTKRTLSHDESEI